MKQTATNQFNDALNLDLHPIVTPNSVLTDNLNGTFITYNGNEFCLQNDKGNVYKASLTVGFTPIGIKEHNGILYIFSCNNEGVGEIGTYPGLDWEKSNYGEEYTGTFLDKYTPLYSLRDPDDHTAVIPFRTDELKFDTSAPLEIEVQDSYDGSVNLIITDGKHVPKIINTRFSVLPDNKYKFIKRGDDNEANIYDAEKVENQTHLILDSTSICNVELVKVSNGGQLKGGNYTFYMKFGDDDGNVTDVVAESGIVSIFKGTDGQPSSISGTLSDELTDKLIQLKVTGINTSYTNLYIFYSREYSDTNGFRMTEYGRFSEPFRINKELYTNFRSEQNIQITGYEQTTNISAEELNVDYHTIDFAKTAAQQQDMLFLGNVGQKETYSLYQKLKEFTLNVTTSIHLDSDGIDSVNNNFSEGDEYYSTQNIYSKLGYWPDEIYRFGIIYILKDGSTTPVFNMCGGTFTKFGDRITKREESLDKAHLDIYNESGVFLTPKDNGQLLSGGSKIRPMYFSFSLPPINDSEIDDALNGWFVVRQKRIPRTVCQGLSIGIDAESGLPLIWTGKNWVIQSFLSVDRRMSKLEERALLKQIEHFASEKNSWWRWIIYGAFAGLVMPVLPFTAEAFAAQALNSYTTGVNGIKNLNEVYSKARMPKLEYMRTSTKYSDKYFGCSIFTKDPQEQIENFNSIGNEDETFWRELEETYMSDGIIWFNPDSSDHEIRNYAIPFYGYESFDKWFNSWKKDKKVILVDTTPTQANFQLYLYMYRIYEINNAKDYVKTDRFYLYLDFAYDGSDGMYPLSARISIDGDPLTISLLTTTDDLKYTEGIQFDDGIKYVEDFINDSNKAISSGTEYGARYIYENDANLNGDGIITLDPCVNNSVATILNGSKMDIIPIYKVNPIFGPEYEETGDKDGSYLCIGNKIAGVINNENTITAKTAFVQSNTASKVIDDFYFKNVAGTAYDKDFETLDSKLYGTIDTKATSNNTITMYSTSCDDQERNVNIVRGLFLPFVGVATNDLKKARIYSIRHHEEDEPDLMHNLFYVRSEDRSPYYCASNRLAVSQKTSQKVFRGDCYTNTVCMRVLRNFIDPEVANTTAILKEDGWYQFLLKKGSDDADDKADPKDEINLTDLNTVDLGYWVSFKCLSSYNLGLRSTNPFNTQEVAMLGGERSFYPLSGYDTSVANKAEESFLLNDGYSATVGRKRYNVFEDIPYSKSEFSNRVMFSNKNVNDAFVNGYRVFQGLSYHDYDKQYGSITKLISWGSNLLCVMEHGIGMIAVNEKALMQTTTEQTIHIYGHGVLSDQMSIISPDYGSKYPETVIRTNIGVYGIDTAGKKIWRYSDKQGFETISDMKIESFLNTNLALDYSIEVGKCDIRTHYNIFKGDVIFAWYTTSDGNKHEYSICYNERQSLWTTRYDWVPLVSENVNGEMFSLQKGEGYPGISIYDHDPVNSFPTNWYGKQHPFEFEFVVSNPIGAHKIFENLQIISNNVQPEELQFEFIGDAYMFNKARIYHTVFERDFDKERVLKSEYFSTKYTVDPNKTDRGTFSPSRPSKAGVYQQQLEKDYRPFKNASVLNDRDLEPVYGSIVKTDNATKQYHLRIPQECRNVESWGRRLGNIQYKNDSWYTTIEPILYDARLNDPRITQLSNPVTKWNSARIRDKWCKIRVRYSGEDLAVITAIKTIVNI